MNKKQRIINWLSIFLLVINISAFATLLLMNNNSTSTSTGLESTEHYKSDEFLKEALNLTDEQYEEVSAMDCKIFRVYQNILDMQCESNFKLMAELSSENPNKHVMDSIAKQIGGLYTGLKRQTIKHFMNIRSICTEEQSVLLDKLIKDMMFLDDQCKYCNKEYCSRRDALNE